MCTVQYTGAWQQEITPQKESAVIIWINISDLTDSNMPIKYKLADRSAEWKTVGCERWHKVVLLQGKLAQVYDSQYKLAVLHSTALKVSSIDGDDTLENHVMKLLKIFASQNGKCRVW